MVQLTCDLCGKDLGADDDWIGLNRWVVNSGGNGRMNHQHKGYKWDIQNKMFTGRALCLYGCAMQWLEAQAIEVASER